MQPPNRTSPIATAIATLAVLTTACGTNSLETAPTETTVTPSVTETLEGRIGVQGAAVHPFVVSVAGSVTALVSSLDPSDAVIGVSLGTWDTAGTCKALLANDSAVIGSSFIGTVSVAGTFCIRIIDVGRLTGPAAYAVSVTHD